MKRAIVIVLDAVGIGALPDAAKYGDEGSNTIIHTKQALPELMLKNMCKLGLGNIEGEKAFEEEEEPKGIYGKLKEVSAGKDTTTGHWEMAGLVLEKPFPTYPEGFPPEITEKFKAYIGKDILGNKAASGTAIINELGDEHVKTGYPIVYTSADSVFQIAAHEDIIPVEKLYDMCKYAREITDVGRVIARPFKGENSNYTRTERRKDFSLPPTGKTMLDVFYESGLSVCAVGKIEDIFAGRSISSSIHTTNNKDGIEKTIDYIKTAPDGLIFTNLVDTDMIYGHRRDVKGFGEALSYFDSKLPEIMEAMTEEDILFITSDHGCDPTFKGTDHTREHALLLVYGKNIKPMNAGVRNSFADIAKTVLKYFELSEKLPLDFANEIELR
ncbi:MAG: phosphopentomutase [Firmicutes bacterium]|nr:phosphopentomutase [Bacillota bacterium]